MGVLKTCLFAIVSLFGYLLTFSTCINLAESLSSQSQASVIVPKTDANMSDDEDFVYRLLYDGLLLLVFIVQHSGCASQWWKDGLTDWGLGPVTRSVYVITTSVTLQYIMRRWQPLPVAPLWLIDTTERDLLWAFFFILHIVLWILIFGAALLMDSLELSGVKQVYYESQDLDEPLSFKSRATQKVYQHMRHPGVTCFLLVLWLHPVMTLGRFVLALCWTLYLLTGHAVTETDYVYVEKQTHKKSVQYVTFELLE